MDGRNKDWWIGFLLGALKAIAFRGDTPPDVKITALKALQEYEEWERTLKP